MLCATNVKLLAPSVFFTTHRIYQNPLYNLCSMNYFKDFNSLYAIVLHGGYIICAYVPTRISIYTIIHARLCTILYDIHILFII